jgi:hypothetical protein
VVILHESNEALGRANAWCDHLLDQHWLEADLEFDRWPFDALQEEANATAVLHAAAEASIVVIAAGTEGCFDEAFCGWAERWVARRAGREGALVGLLTSGSGTSHIGCERDVALHHLALRAGVDYLSQLPEGHAGGIPEETEWCSDRASTVTGTLSEILERELQPHLG